MRAPASGVDQPARGSRRQRADEQDPAPPRACHARVTRSRPRRYGVRPRARLDGGGGPACIQQQGVVVPGSSSSWWTSSTTAASRRTRRARTAGGSSGGTGAGRAARYASVRRGARRVIGRGTVAQVRPGRRRALVGSACIPAAPMVSGRRRSARPLPAPAPAARGGAPEAEDDDEGQDEGDGEGDGAGGAHEVQGADSGTPATTAAATATTATPVRSTATLGRRYFAVNDLERTRILGEHPRAPRSLRSHRSSSICRVVSTASAKPLRVPDGAEQSETRTAAAKQPGRAGRPPTRPSRGGPRSRTPRTPGRRQSGRRGRALRSTRTGSRRTAVSWSVRMSTSSVSLRGMTGGGPSRSPPRLVRSGPGPVGRRPGTRSSIRLTPASRSSGRRRPARTRPHPTRCRRGVGHRLAHDDTARASSSSARSSSATRRGQYLAHPYPAATRTRDAVPALPDAVPGLIQVTAPGAG